MLITAVIFGASGLAFAIGNILLARVLSMETFGQFALALAIFNLFIWITPLGLDQLVLRQRIDPGVPVLLLLTTAGACIGGVAAYVSVLSGGLSAAEAIPAIVAILAGGISTVVAGMLRAAQLPWKAVPFSTGSNWMVLAIGCLAVTLEIRSLPLLLWLFAAANCVRSATGWAILCRGHRVPTTERAKIYWPEGFSLLGITATGALMLQAERLIIPIMLDLSALATFSVLASVAIFPFRLFISATSFVLIPQLRAAATSLQRRAVIRAEFFLIATALGIASAVIIPGVPYAVPVITAGQYHISAGLAATACLNGAVKMVTAVIRSVVTACGSRRQIAWMNGFDMLWLGCTALGAWLGAVWGLEGLIIGVSIGSSIASIPSIELARRSLRNPPAT